MSAPLTITLLTPGELSVLTLPENCGGQFHLTDHVTTEDGKVKARKLVSIEGKISGWVAKSTRVASVLDASGKPVKSLEIKNNSTFFVALAGAAAGGAAASATRGRAASAGGRAAAAGGRAAAAGKGATAGGGRTGSSSTAGSTGSTGSTGSVKYIAKCQSAEKDTRTFTKYYTEDNSAYLIGRSNKCDLKIDSALVSGEHVKLNFRREQWVLRDLNSSNGTYVNNARVVPNTDVLLDYGDTIYVMGVSVVVCNGFIAFNNPSKSVSTSKNLPPLNVEPYERATDALGAAGTSTAEGAAGTSAHAGASPGAAGATAGTAGAPFPEPDAEIHTDYYYRSPRFMREIEVKKIVVEAPPAAQQQNDMPLIATIGPAVTMGMASLFSGVMMAYNTLSSNGSVTQAMPMLIMSISMLLGMCLWPFITRKYQNAKWIKEERTRQVKYRDYLDRMKEKILSVGDVQGSILAENIIDTKTAAERVFNVSRNLWERTPNHSDFLNVRLGRGNLPIAANIEFPKTPFSLDNDSLLDAIGELKREERIIHNVPIPYSLIENRVAGIIGARARVLEYVKMLVSQIVSLHSYDEVKLVFLTDAEEDAENSAAGAGVVGGAGGAGAASTSGAASIAAQTGAAAGNFPASAAPTPRTASAWDWAKMLPHTFSNTHQMRFFATNLEEARTLSLYFDKLLADRIENKQTFDQEKTTPYYVVISASRNIALKTEFVEKLLRVPENYGFSLLCLYDELKFLPKECKSVIDVNAAENSAQLYDKDDTTGAVTKIALEEGLPADLQASLFTSVANISLDLDSARYMLPKSISFLDMFEVGKVEHLNVGARWSENTAAASLSTPVGVDQNGEQFMLDLHEKVHGPHGLVAGMTGSGKSEFIITYILSLAVNYSPDEVAFVLIDYKGGGLAGAFENEKVRLPHLAGTITNLDGAAINRSLVSIESELKRRQAVFNHARDVSNAGTMDIYAYQRLYREGVVHEAVPHLFIISDEFAELKQQQPEFMEQLISTARIGRSLGVHLILATQKPSGVVNDQIWSNSKFKVCLKVQDKADSQEMIKRPEAAELVDTGRFYLQVGYNEYFALGQSAWCGAPYAPREEYVAAKQDMRVVAINNLGVEVAAAAPAFAQAGKSDVRQIVAIIEHICTVAAQRHLFARELWLPPLPEVSYLEDIEAEYAPELAAASAVSGGAGAAASAGTSAPISAFTSDTRALIGLIDDPARQRRLPLVVDIQGGVIVYGTTGSGKFVFLSSLLYSLMRHNPAQNFNAYIIDCGSETLNAFRAAPHVGDVILASEKEKIVNCLKMISAEIKTRKKNFSRLGVGVEEYRAQSGVPCPKICVMINGIGAFSELYPDAVDFLATLTREGVKYGINFVVSASSTSDIRFRLAQNFATSYVLRMNDENDYSSILGRRTNGGLPDVCGRGYLVQDSEVLEFQVAYAGSGGDLFGQLKQVSENLGAAAAAAQAYTARKVPILPEVVNKEFFASFSVTTQKFPIGVEKASLDTMCVNLPKDAMSFVVGADIEGVCDFAAELSNLAITSGLSVAALCTSANVEDQDCFDNLLDTPGLSVYTDAHEFVEALRSAGAVAAGGAGGSSAGAAEDSSAENNTPALTADVCLMFDVSNTLDAMAFEDKKFFKDYFEGLKRGAASFVMCATGAEMGAVKYDAWVSKHLNVGASVWIGNGFADQSCFKIGRFTMDLYDEVEPMFGYVVSKQKPVLTKLLSAAERG